VSETKLGELSKRLKHQEAETVKAESKFQFALKENEQLKAKFATERSAFDTEKASLVKRAEEVESQLKQVAEELAGLKRHITQMTAAIFGKIHTLEHLFEQYCKPPCNS
jgi:chromosome segregation ATPase